MSSPKKLICERDFAASVHLSEARAPHTHTHLHTVYVYTVYLFIQGSGEGGGGGGLPRENVRGAIVHKAGRKYQQDGMYLQSINSMKHQ